MAGRADARRDRGQLENEVLAALAAASGPLTPAHVLAELGAGLAYTTVMTTLTRLHGKGAVSRARAGRAYAYVLADDATVAARRMRRVLDDGQDRAVVLARFFDELDPADVPVLAQLLARAQET
ncbi:BlaI/MecI/CopY family transcriptional regulator [Pengzhenrongella sp.]|jgi:predicted transcriptional regulator|uniref:BlaI/MecI/CopY family transcriptional regulator n=1 Tax=Pengzhenrongella sp. TaxID=2888820 RepID=UPI002F93121A